MVKARIAGSLVYPCRSKVAKGCIRCSKGRCLLQDKDEHDWLGHDVVVDVVDAPALLPEVLEDDVDGTVVMTKSDNGGDHPLQCTKGLF